LVCGRSEELISPKNGALSGQEQADLVAFLGALTGEIDPEVGRAPVLP
jgi:hypothetical protein